MLNIFISKVQCGGVQTAIRVPPICFRPLNWAEEEGVFNTDQMGQFAMSEFMKASKRTTTTTKLVKLGRFFRFVSFFVPVSSLFRLVI